jgi:hypothetical protein
MHCSYHAIIEILSWSEIVCAGARGYLVDPFTERHQLRLRPLTQAAETLLRQQRAPARLIAHLLLIHDVAAQLLDAFHARGLADAINDEAVLFGAAIHDIGKVLYPNELTGPGNQHEQAGQVLLLQAGIPPKLARFAATHGKPPTTANSTIEDLLVALADTCWKGKRDLELEQQIATERAAHGDHDQWTTFLMIDDIVEQIAATADRRLVWQALFPADV